MSFIWITSSIVCPKKQGEWERLPGKKKKFFGSVYTNVPLAGVFPQRVRAKEMRDRMGTTGQMLITAGAVLSAGILLLTTYNRVYRWTLRQKAQDRELSAIRKENTLLTYGVLACLKGLEEQGCDGPVHEAIDKIERDLNLRAHDQEGNCG